MKRTHNKRDLILEIIEKWRKTDRGSISIANEIEHELKVFDRIERMKKKNDPLAKLLKN